MNLAIHQSVKAASYTHLCDYIPLSLYSVSVSCSYCFHNSKVLVNSRQYNYRTAQLWLITRVNSCSVRIRVVYTAVNLHGTTFYFSLFCIMDSLNLRRNTISVKSQSYRLLAQDSTIERINEYIPRQSSLLFHNSNIFWFVGEGDETPSFFRLSTS